MYLSHYDLKTKPFQISTNPRFLWFGEKHKEAFAALKYGILCHDGYVLVTGDVGTGKTTLMNAVISSLDARIKVAKIRDPGIGTLDFFRLVAKEYEIAEHFDSKGSFLLCFTDFLQSSYSDKKKIVLMIDESQRMSQELIEEILHLSNIEKHDAKLLKVVLVGQNRFNTMLLDPSNRPFRQRISNNYNIETLTEIETGDYIKYRLKIAGCENDIFSPEAIREVFLFARGTPRLINIICNLALLSGYLENTKVIGSKIINECEGQLRLPDEKIAPDTEKAHPIPEARQEPRKEPAHETGQEDVPQPVMTSERRHVGRNAAFATLLVLLLFALGYGYFLGGFNLVRDDASSATSTEQVKAEVEKSTGSDAAAAPETVALTETAGPSSPTKTLAFSDDWGEDIKTSDDQEHQDSLEGVMAPGRHDVSERNTEITDETLAESSPASPVRFSVEVSPQPEIVDNEPKTLEEQDIPREEEAEITQPAGTEPTGQNEASGQGALPPDPTDVIDWLLKRHSGQE